MKKTIFLRIFLGYASIILLLALGVTLFAPPLMREHHVHETVAGLDHLGLLLEDRVIPFLTGSAAGGLRSVVVTAARETATRITVIDGSGSVLADSEGESADMENHFYRPEIQAALQGREQMSIRYSSTLNAEMLYLSLPLRTGGRIVGALRLSVFMKDFEALLGALRSDLLKVVLVATVIALVLAFVFARSVSRPAHELAAASSRALAGDFEGRVTERRGGEFGELARGHNAMASRLKTAAAEKRLRDEEIRGILAAVGQGLCVLDGESRIIVCNEAFRGLAANEAPEGHYIWEVVRSTPLREVVRKVCAGGVTASAEAVIGEKTYVFSASCLAAGERVVVSCKNVTA